MSKLKLSSTDWMAISLKNGGTGMFCLHDIYSWQYLERESISDQADDRCLVKFSPDGQWFACNGQNKQLNVYIRTDLEETDVWWKLQRIIQMKNLISSIELTNNSVYIADINGDIYQVDLALNDQNQDLIISPDNCIMKHKSMLLDMTFIQMNKEKSFLITAGQDAQIRLNDLQNPSNIEGHCLGHTEFVSHVKLIDNHCILSASGDGTIRLWHLPDCVPLMLFHSKAFALLSKEVFYTELGDLESSYQLAATSPSSSISSIIDYSIWKFDVTTYDSDIFLAFSIYAHRSHSIYLTNLSNLKELSNKQRKLTLDLSYGTIVDYCLVNHHSDLYILFDSNILLRINIMLILAYNQTEYFAQPNETIQEINNILTQKEFHLMDSNNNNYLTSDDMNYKRLFKSEMNYSSSSCKRKSESMENEERKKQVSPKNEEANYRTTFEECF